MMRSILARITFLPDQYVNNNEYFSQYMVLAVQLNGCIVVNFAAAEDWFEIEFSPEVDTTESLRLAKTRIEQALLAVYDRFDTSEVRIL